MAKGTATYSSDWTIDIPSTGGGKYRATDGTNYEGVLILNPDLCKERAPRGGRQLSAVVVWH